MTKQKTLKSPGPEETEAHCSLGRWQWVQAWKACNGLWRAWGDMPDSRLVHTGLKEHVPCRFTQNLVSEDVCAGLGHGRHIPCSLEYLLPQAHTWPGMQSGRQDTIHHVQGL